MYAHKNMLPDEILRIRRRNLKLKQEKKKIKINDL